VILFLYSCSSIDCPLNNVVYSRYAFYGIVNGTSTTVKLNDTLTVTAFGTDSVLINKDYGASSLDIPVSYYNPVDTLLFRYSTASGVAFDTIWVEKNNYEHFESTDCPTAMFHNIIKVNSTHNLIDTVKIENSVIDYEEKTNFQIHFHSN
jgi:hypothetical protein